MLYGYNLGSRSLVFWDRFACDNAVVLGRSGAGKSYLVKLELLRSLYRGIHAHVIDPDDEYTRLAHAVGATIIRPGAPGVYLNPLDLPLSRRRQDGTRTAPRDALTRRALFLHTFLDVLLTTTAGNGQSGGQKNAGLSAVERAVLDTAITATYTRAGITADPTTWTRPAPLRAARMLDRMRGYAADAGRDGAKIGVEARIEVRYGERAHWPALMEGWRALGASHMAISTMGLGLTGAEHLGAIERLHRELVG